MIHDILKIIGGNVIGSQKDNTDISKYLLIVLITAYIMSRNEFSASNIMTCPIPNIGISQATINPLKNIRPMCNLIPLTLFLMFVGLFIYTVVTFIYGILNNSNVMIDGCIISNIGNIIPFKPRTILGDDYKCPFRGTKVVKPGAERICKYTVKEGKVDKLFTELKEKTLEEESIEEVVNKDLEKEYIKIDDSENIDSKDTDDSIDDTNESKVDSIESPEINPDSVK